MWWISDLWLTRKEIEYQDKDKGMDTSVAMSMQDFMGEGNKPEANLGYVTG